MNYAKRKRLERAGFRVGSVQDFLNLTDEEMSLIELKVRLVEMLRGVRKARRLTQQRLARLLRSSQSRVAKMEAGNSDVSLEMICRALFAMGITQRDIGRALTQRAA